VAVYRKSPEAERDLIQIWMYVATESRSAATQFIDRLHGHMGDLADMPGMGRIRVEFGPLVRSFAVDDFLIFYRESQAGIDVIRVLSGRRDLRSVFEGE